MINDEIQRHCAEINRCNQRGGRMLSIVDLVDAGTVTRDLAAYSLAVISQGASFMVGAVPGGAGKTAVMGAWLNFIPPDVQLTPAVDASAIEHGINSREQRFCCICHEIGKGSYYAYLWGSVLRRYFDLSDAGHMLATNLHADTYVKAQQQICGQNNVSVAAFRRMNLIFFLTVKHPAASRGASLRNPAKPKTPFIPVASHRAFWRRRVNRKGWSMSRRITEVWESDGQKEHHQILGSDSIPLIESSRLVSAGNFAKAKQNINQIMDSGVRTIEDVRSMLLQR